MVLKEIRNMLHVHKVAKPQCLFSEVILTTFIDVLS